MQPKAVFIIKIIDRKTAAFVVSSPCQCYNME